MKLLKICYVFYYYYYYWLHSKVGLSGTKCSVILFGMCLVFVYINVSNKIVTIIVGHH